MKTYKAITINGEPKLEPVNPAECTKDNIQCLPRELCECSQFTNTNPPIDYIGPAIPDGTILDESEVEIKDEVYNPYDFIWEKITHPDTVEGLQKLGASTRRVATRKAKEPKKNIDLPSINESYDKLGIDYSMEYSRTVEAEKERPLAELKEKQQNLKAQIETLEAELRTVNNKIYWIENPQGDF